MTVNGYHTRHGIQDRALRMTGYVDERANGGGGPTPLS